MVAHAVSQWGATLAPKFLGEFGVADEYSPGAADLTGAAMTSQVADGLIDGRWRCPLRSLPLSGCEAETETTRRGGTT